MNIVIGIDPGISGGIAVVNSTNVAGVLLVAKMPETKTDLVTLLESLKYTYAASNIAVYLEKVHSMPAQGVKSTWTFARNVGQIEGAVTALKLRMAPEVAPRVWQTYHKCLSKGDKNVTKNRAQQLYPNTKITHAVADALLIANYGWVQEYGKNNSTDF